MRRLEQVAGVEQPGQIVKDVLGVALGADAGDGEAGGLRLGADDGEVLADRAR